MHYRHEVEQLPIIDKSFLDFIGTLQPTPSAPSGHSMALAAPPPKQGGYTCFLEVMQDGTVNVNLRWAVLPALQSQLGALCAQVCR